MAKDVIYYTTDKDEVIPVDEVIPSPRGKHLPRDEELIESLRTPKPWEALRLGSTFGQVEKDDRNRVSHLIRRHWELARDDSPRIDFSPDGVPQVRVRERRAA